MLRINCPYCGLRDQVEFSYGGEAHTPRPAEPDRLDDTAWAEYLFYRRNPKGLHHERWVHSFGCRQWFNAVRDTMTHEIHETCPVGDLPGIPLAGGAGGGK